MVCRRWRLNKIPYPSLKALSEPYKRLEPRACLFCKARPRSDWSMTFVQRRNAKRILVLIGERPGLSSPDSLGCNCTLGGKVGLTDAATATAFPTFAQRAWFTKKPHVKPFIY